MRKLIIQEINQVSGGANALFEDFGKEMAFFFGLGLGSFTFGVVGGQILGGIAGFNLAAVHGAGVGLSYASGVAGSLLGAAVGVYTVPYLTFSAYSWAQGDN